MSKKSGSDEETKKSFSNPTVLAAIIGVIGTIVVTLITTSPQLIAALKSPTETPIPTSTATSPPTNAPLPTETEVVPPTATSTNVPPTPTETVVSSPTPVDPGIACLDRWEIISSNPDLAIPVAGGNCDLVSIPGMGISTSGSELIFGQNNFREQGTFGLSTAIPLDATIRMKVKRGILTRGEFWIALSNKPNPESNMMILAIQPEFGEVRTYAGQTSTAAGRYTWEQLVENTTYGDGPPYTYDLILKTDGSLVDTRINFLDLPSQIVNLPKYLFIGYQNASTLGSVSMSITVSDLTIELGQ